MIIISKICSKCNVEKKLNQFQSDKQGKWGLRSYCRNCRYEYEKKYRDKNKTKKAQYIKQWKINNSGTVTSWAAKRRANKLNATPSWLTEEQLRDIKLFYAKSTQLQQVTGIKHHVDHIIPLQGKNVSGLHVPWNLQILTATENLKKGNRPQGREVPQ